jgi:RNA polymerase sigma-70 factor (sigma-E family)
MAKAKHDDEFSEFVASRAGWLRKVAYLLCADWHRADDLVQETVTKLYTHWGRVSRADSVEAYARRVLVNTFLAEQRTGWGRFTVRHAAGPADAEALAGAQGVADLEAGLDLRQALAGLPPRQRAAVVLRHYCDLSVEQTAEALGCSTGNVKSQTSRGLDSLRRLLTVEPASAAERMS